MVQDAEPNDRADRSLGGLGYTAEKCKEWDVHIICGLFTDHVLLVFAAMVPESRGRFGGGVES